MSTNSTPNTTRALFLKIAKDFDKSPNLEYAAKNARILAEPGKYSADEIQSPDIELSPGEKEPYNMVAWPEMGRKLDRYIYYNTETNEVEDEDYEVIGMRMAPDNEHRDYWIMFQL